MLRKRTLTVSQNMSESVRQYKNALVNPFDTSAIGVRVPDAFAMPTVTYHVRGAATCYTDSNGTWFGALLPSPCFTLIQGAGTILGNLTNFAQNTACFFVANPTTLSAAFSEYRVVSWGLRILPKDTALNLKGKFYVAIAPTTANAPSWNTMNTVTATNNGVVGEYCFGYPITNSSFGPGIMNLPSCRTFTVQDLMRGEIQISGLPINTSFYDFRGTADRVSNPWNTNQTLADEFVYNTTPAIVNSTAGGRKDVASLRGGMAVMIQFSGGQPSANEFDIEYIYHLEGTPNSTSADGGALIPSSARASTGNSFTVENVIAAAHMAGRVISHIANPVARTAGALALGLAQSGGTRPLQIAY